MFTCGGIERQHALFLGYLLLSGGLASGFCVFDRVQHQQDVEQMVDRGTHYDVKRSKRGLWEDLHKPLRVHVHYSRLEEEIGQQNVDRVVNGVSYAVEKASHIFSVIPVEGKLLFSRSGTCKLIYTDGINKGKCSAVNTAYAGETCAGDFKLPDEHLEGIYEWNTTHPDPVHVVRPEGAGLPDKDFVLYVEALTTKYCSQGGDNIIAYASYCKLAPNYRPIAGYINFCPAVILSKTFNPDKFKLMALHELFHTLGFARDLFDKMQTCKTTESGVECQTRPRTVAMWNGMQRLITPKLVELASAHYGCVTNPTINEFGPVLETKNGDVTSHWDGAFLYGSLMSPSVGEPHLVVVDEFSLAFFEDTGWYKVDYSHAEPFIWGKDGGCDFGKVPECLNESSSYFCNVLDAYGCHYRHLDKAKCTNSTHLRQCMAYLPTLNGNCQLSSNEPSDKQALKVFGEKYQKDSRCFVADLILPGYRSTDGKTGRCYQHRCINETVEVKVGTADWQPCPPGESIQVTGFQGSLECPPDGVLCYNNTRHMTRAPRTTTVASRTTQHSPTGAPAVEGTAEPSILCVEITFLDGDYHALDSSSLLLAFRDAIILCLVTKTDLTQPRMANIYLLPGSVLFNFDVTPASSPSDVSASQIYSSIRSLVDAGQLLVSLQGKVYQATSVRLRMEEASPSRGLGPGPIAGIVLSIVVAVAIAAGLLYFAVHRYLKNRNTSVQPNVRPQQTHSQQNGGQPNVVHREPHRNARQESAAFNYTPPSTRVSSASSHASRYAPSSHRTSVSGASTLSGLMVNGHTASPPGTAVAEVEADRTPSVLSTRNIQLHNSINV